MNFFKHKDAKRKIDFNKTTLICPKSLCEDLPRSCKASKVVLTLPRYCKKANSLTPSYQKASHSRASRQSGRLLTLGEVNNETLYSFPSFTSPHYPSPSSSSTSSSLKILPHRFTVECNVLQRVRALQKSKPKLRKLVIKLN